MKKKSIQLKKYIVLLLILVGSISSAVAQELNIKIAKQYLNIPISRQATSRLIRITVDGKIKREFPVQIAEESIDYWIYIDVSEFKNKKITLSNAIASQQALNRIYQDDMIAQSENLYKETYRPQFHFTTKRGWSNDVNGLIYYNNKYHLFWQSFPFGTKWNTGFMYWGHATSEDLIHWEELSPALMLDKLGSPWSGTALIDKNNDAGWGKDAMVLYYTAFDQLSGKQVQCIAYSTDEAKTFKRYDGNPVLDSNKEMQTNDTRDPKVFWYAPTKHWVMVLFEKNGMGFYSSTDMKTWKKESFFEGLHECPDFFKLPLDGDTNNQKWVLHGASSEYLIGEFDGKTFKPLTQKKRYADGINKHNQNSDILYAGLTFENMPNDRRVQMAWGRWIEGEGMPFTQIMLFPTEFALKTTDQGLQLMATPIKEIEKLHAKSYSWSLLKASEANQKLETIAACPIHLKMKITLNKGHVLRLRYQGNEIINIPADQFRSGENDIEILIDKLVAEIFINNGDRYIVKELALPTNDDGLMFDSEKYGPYINKIELHELNSIWSNAIKH